MYPTLKKLLERIGLLDRPKLKLLPVSDGEILTNKIDRDIFYKNIRKLGRLTQHNVAGLNQLLDMIEKDKTISNINHIAYFLATVKHETGVSVYGVNQTYHPVIEQRPDSNAERKYGHKTRIGRVLGNLKAGDGSAFKGVGYVQVTGRGNAKKLQKALKVNLTVPISNFRKKLREPEWSYKAAIYGMRVGLFTGRKLTDYDLPRNKFDGLLARRIINGLDKAALIDSYFRIFKKALEKSTGK